MSAGPSQHYVFVHRALPSVLFRDPSWLFAVLNGPDAQRLLGDLWTRAGERSPPSERREADGLGVETFLDDSHLFALITLPPPLEVAEAHLAAAVAGFVAPDRPSLDALAWARFFTLEHGLDFRTEEPCTFLCEWTPDGRHHNLGGGPPAEAGAFVQAVQALLRATPPPGPRD